MDRRFKEGQKLNSVVMNNGFTISIFDKENPIKEISIVMEDGQMAGVPWARVVYGDDSIEKLNLAFAMAVSLREKETDV